MQGLNWLLRRLWEGWELRSKEPYFSDVIDYFSALILQNSYSNSHPLDVYNFRSVLSVVLLELPESSLKLCVGKGRCSKEMLGQVSKTTEMIKGKFKQDILRRAIAPTNCKVQRQIPNSVHRAQGLQVHVALPCVLVGVWETCQILFLEHDSKDSRAGMRSWNNVKQAGRPPLPSPGAGSTHMWGRCFHTRLSICFLDSLIRKEMLIARARPEPLLSVGPKTPPVMAFGTCQVHASVRAAVHFHLYHVSKNCSSQVSLLRKATRPGNVREGRPETDM